MSGTINTHAARLAALVAIIGGCAAPEPQLTAWTPAPLGATWEVAQRNTGSYGKDTQFKVTRGDGSWQGAPAITMKTSQGGTIVARPSDGKWFAVLAPDGKPVMSFDPPVGWELPLQVGKSWSTRHRLTVGATGNTVDYQFSCKVEAFEKVTVRAGTFDAFRVHCNTSSGSDETYWSSPGLGPFVKTRLIRPAGNPFGPGTQEAELVATPSR